MLLRQRRPKTCSSLRHSLYGVVHVEASWYMGPFETPVGTGAQVDATKYAYCRDILGGQNYKTTFAEFERC